MAQIKRFENVLDIEEPLPVWIMTEESLGDIRKAAFPPEVEVIVMVDGAPVPETELDRYYPQHGQKVTMAPRGGSTAI